MNIRFVMVAMAALMISACGGSPTQDTSAQPEISTQEQELGKKCGTNTCGAGEYCCNESCGICVPNGGSCTQQVCEPAPLPCGTNSCGTGEYCCNASCGICAPIGGGCIQQYCG